MKFPDPDGTILLVDPRLVSYFEKGVDVLSLPEAQARAMLGDAAYEELMEAKRVSVPRGTVTVTAIDGRRITTSAKDDGEEEA